MTKPKKKVKDPRNIGVPNINFSLSDLDDEREKEFKKQRKKRGFDESETWCLTSTIAHFIIPRLAEFIEITDGMHKDQEKYIKDCKSLLKALKLIVRDDGVQLFNEKEQKSVNKGLKVFPKIFLGLWW